MKKPHRDDRKYWHNRSNSMHDDTWHFNEEMFKSDLKKYNSLHRTKIGEDE